MNSFDLLKKEFLHPDDEFTPIPFWFWNGDLIETEIRRQIHDFKSKGVMGFVIHPRIGMPKELQYLSTRFMDLVQHAVEEASACGMKVVLYDEGMYPSGSAHGMVVQDTPQYASRGLKMSEYPICGSTEIVIAENEEENTISVLAVLKTSENGYLAESVCKLSVEQQKVSFVPPHPADWSVLVFTECFSKGTIRGIHFGEDDSEPFAPPSADLLNLQAMQKFIHITHDKYYEALSVHFGKTIIAFFTDEPGILGRNPVKGLIPWTEGFLQWYTELGNDERSLPALWLEAGDKTEEIRRGYHRAVSQKLEESYYRPISNWCEEHGIALTGHPEKSDDIGLMKHFHIPGQDIVWRWVAPEEGKAVEGEHSTMAKCSSDAARHFNRRRNANECFGCCGPNGIHWAFSADDMKWYLDWMFVRGVNLIYPHAFFYSLDGPGRYGERPPDVGPNNIWWGEYSSFSSYIKRMCWLMTDSVNQARIAVLCGYDSLPWKAVKPLYQNQLEFNYLEDRSLLSCAIEGGKIKLLKQEYSVVLVEDTGLIDEEINKKLSLFLKQGGRVINYHPPEYPCAAESMPQADVNLFYDTNTSLEGLTGYFLINNDDKLLEMVKESVGDCPSFEPLVSHLRLSHVIKNEIHFYLLTNEGEEEISGLLLSPIQGKTEIWNSWSGEITCLKALSADEKGMRLSIKLQRRESLILCIDPSQAAGNASLFDNSEETEQFEPLELRAPPKNSEHPEPLEQSEHLQKPEHPEKFDQPKQLIESEQKQRGFVKDNIKDNEWYIALNGPWQVTASDRVFKTNITKLRSWTEWPEMKYYSGTFVYETVFKLHADDLRHIWALDMGEVHEIVKVTINGLDAGAKMWKPYTLNITPFIKEGSNRIKLQVTNSLANHYEQVSLKSGLLGPVRLHQIP